MSRWRVFHAASYCDLCSLLRDQENIGILTDEKNRLCVRCREHMIEQETADLTLDLNEAILREIYGF